MDAAVIAGNSSTGRVLEEVKMNIDRSEHPYLAGGMRKTAALEMALTRKKRAAKGYSAANIPTTAEEFMQFLPKRFTVTSTGEPFLAHKEYTDDEGEDCILIFISDHGKFILSKSEEIFIDGTFDTCPLPFSQIFVILGRIEDQRPIPAI